MKKWIQRKPKNKVRKEDSLIDMVGSIRGVDDMDLFIRPTKDDLIDPYDMKNIVKASERIKKAIENEENIVVSMDCDADGVSSTAILIRYLRNYTDNVDFIYGERSNGHGLTEQIKFNDSMDDVRKQLNTENAEKIKNSSLLIVVDSSSNEEDTIKRIASTGVDVIVLDHHEIEKKLVSGILVNPLQEGCMYANKNLSGAGVVYKTIQVVEDLMGNNVDVEQYLDLVAVGMYADMMRIDVMENRYIIMAGLRNIKNVGLTRILKGAKADLYRLNGDSIGFSVAPMINGVARLDNIKLAIDILLEDDDKKCKPIRLKMQKLNEKRREMQKEIVERYEKIVDDSKKAIVVMDDNASGGFNGLVSQQLSSKYKRPAIVGRLHKGVFSGSFRSYGRFRMKSFLSESELVEESMGHEPAGGITVKEENIEALLQYIEDHMQEITDDSDAIIYDLEITPEQVEEYARDMDAINLVTGIGFPKVVVKISGLSVDEAGIIGKTMETFKVKTFNELELIKFKVNEDYGKDLGVFDDVAVVGVLSVNEFYNFGLRKKVITNQIVMQDYKVL